MKEPGLSVSRGKQELVYVPSRGKAVENCQGKREDYLCCSLKTVSVVENCPYDCSYCFLQFYLTRGETSIASNLASVKEALLKLSQKEPHKVHRITSGELGDSLALENYTGQAEELARFVETLSGVVLELKTKSTNVGFLLPLKLKKTFVSFSLSPEKIVQEEEHRTPSLKKRLDAAAQLQEAGYFLSFHFDPLIAFPGWERAYEELVNQLFEAIDPASILYISLGGLRFQRKLLRSLYLEKPASLLLTQELFLDRDGKMRYPLFLRKRLYRHLVELVRKYYPEAILYLCMEFREAWEGIIEPVPETEEELEALLLEPIFKKMVPLWQEKEFCLPHVLS